ncbi:MAG: 50S ribosomal protein L30 [Candidatus Altiarchaeales archaeon]|nr:50S ribosomal protein L30 [Candidatus Altiarchaeales archaeon]MBD3415797.1 50S ribosomal protein L30 [Candidatus Altiarchaeales archaeon]
MSGSLVIVRVRGRTHIKANIEDTMKMLSITRKNHCTIVPDNPEYRGMVTKANDYIAWGEADEKTTAKLLSERGKVEGGKKLSDSHVKDNSSFTDIKSFAKAVSAGEAKLKDVKGLKPLFRLNPPKKGFERKGIKKPYSVGGALGYRGEKISELIGRMM